MRLWYYYERAIEISVKVDCLVLIAGVQGKHKAQKFKSSAGRINVPLKHSFWLTLYKNSNLSDHILKR